MGLVDFIYHIILLFKQINMKKIILFLSLFFITLSSYSQTVIKTTQSRIGKWDVITETWNYTAWESNNITFTANDNGVTADDKANSVYTFTSLRKKTTGIAKDGVPYTSYNWDAIDESGLKCKFSIISYKGQGNKLSVMYSDIVFSYLF